MKLSDEVGIKSWLVLLYKVLSAAVRNLDLPMYCLCPLVPSAPPRAACVRLLSDRGYKCRAARVVN